MNGIKARFVRVYLLPHKIKTAQPVIECIGYSIYYIGYSNPYLRGWLLELPVDGSISGGVI